MFEQITATLVAFICNNCKEYDLTYDNLCQVAEASRQFNRVRAIKILRAQAEYGNTILQTIVTLTYAGFEIRFPEDACQKMGLKEAKELTEAIDMLWTTNKQYRVESALAES